MGRRINAAPVVQEVLRTRRRVNHVVAKLATLTLGFAYVSSSAAAYRRWRDRHLVRPHFSGRIALAAHAFYPDLIGEILACHATLPEQTDLFVTTSVDALPRAETELGGVQGAHLSAAPNRGRDIAPFLTLLNRGALEGYDAVLKLHTKRSPHLRDGNIRRRLLFTLLAGSRRRTAQALALFEDPKTGLVGWGPCWRHKSSFWMNNRARVGELARRMGIAPPGEPAFFEGSMFWVRPAALARLRGLDLTIEQFEPEEGQLDGALHHAVERSFALAVAAEGYVVRDLKGRILLGPADVVRESPAG